MVVCECSPGLGSHQQKRQKNGTDDHVRLRGDLSKVDSACLVFPQIPAIDVGHEDQIIDNGVGDGGFDAGHHCALRFALRVLFPGPTVLLDHAHQLDVAGHDGRDGGDETCAKEKIGDAGDVKEGGGRAKARGKELGLDPGGGEGIENVQGPGKRVEGDWEMDKARVCGKSGESASVQRLGLTRSYFIRTGSLLARCST